MNALAHNLGKGRAFSIDNPPGGYPEWKEIQQISYLNTLFSNSQQMHDHNPPLRFGIQ